MIYETTYSNARAHLASLMDQVTDTREPILIRRRGAESVALVAADELAGWMETAYLLRSPKNAQRLLDGSRRAAAGEGIPLSVEQLRVRCADSLPAPGPGVSTRSTVWSIESNQPAYDSSQPGTTTEQRPEPALPLARMVHQWHASSRALAEPPRRRLSQLSDFFDAGGCPESRVRATVVP